MAGVERLAARLDAGGVVVLDGAIGTELERLGAPMHGAIWCGHAIETHPHLIAEVHRSYLAAGADVITANTYATGRHALALAGLEDRTVDWNSRAVEIALAERDRVAPGQEAWVAGSIAPFGRWRDAEAEELRASYAEQAEILIGAGVDLLILEMLAAPPDFVTVALEETLGRGVPVWVGLSCTEDRESGRLMYGVEESRGKSTQRIFEPFADVARRAQAMGPAAVLMMHSEFAVTRAAVEDLRAALPGPVGAYPNAGYWIRPEWAFEDQVAPEAYAEAAAGWVAAGAQIVGGCCGIGPEHIAAMHNKLAAA